MATTRIAICSGETARPPSENASPETGSTSERGSLPNVNITACSRMMPAATVAISQALEPARTNGRTATRSISMPHSAHSASAATMASAIGQPSVTENR